jgi:hypothetical protein
VKVVPWAKSRLTRSFVSISVRQSSSCRRIGKREGGTEGSLPLTSRRKSRGRVSGNDIFLAKNRKVRRWYRGQSPRVRLSRMSFQPSHLPVTRRWHRRFGLPSRKSRNWGHKSLENRLLRRLQRSQCLLIEPRRVEFRSRRFSSARVCSHTAV